MSRLAIAIEDALPRVGQELDLPVDERTSAALFKSRRDPVLLYRHVRGAFVMFSATARVAALDVLRPGEPWRLVVQRSFATPVTGEDELGAPRVQHMLQLTPERFAAIVTEGERVNPPAAVEEAGTAFAVEGSNPSPAVLAALEQEVLRRWDYRCAITGQVFPPHGNTLKSWTVVEIMPRRLGGPMHAANRLPMIPAAGRAFRRGEIGVGPGFDLLGRLNVLDPDLLEMMSRSGKLILPAGRELWPSAEYLAFHRNHIFGH